MKTTNAVLSTLLRVMLAFLIFGFGNVSFPSNYEPPQNTAKTEWIKVPYDKAENEVLVLFQRDLHLLENKIDSLAVYEIRLNGGFPPDHRFKFRQKLEKIILTSKKLSLKECSGCDEARLIRNEKGELKYEAFSTEADRPAKIAAGLGVGHLLIAELNYSNEDLQLSLRLIQGDNRQIVWTKNYSTADVIKTRDSIADIESDSDRLGYQDSLARLVIGEIAFTTILSPGFALLPTISKGSGSGLTGNPSFDLLIGENYGRHTKTFGLQFGFSVNMGTKPQEGTPLPWAFRFGPKFKYHFNPYNMSTARYALGFETGAFISTGYTSAYFGLGPEITMLNRFSVSVIPIYIIPGDVSGASSFIQNPGGDFEEQAKTKLGRFGGPALLFKANIHW